MESSSFYVCCHGNLNELNIFKVMEKLIYYILFDNLEYQLGKTVLNSIFLLHRQIWIGRTKLDQLGIKPIMLHVQVARSSLKRPPYFGLERFCSPDKALVLFYQLSGPIDTLPFSLLRHPEEIGRAIITLVSYNHRVNKALNPLISWEHWP
jgi:hypothetical protein